MTDFNTPTHYVLEDGSELLGEEQYVGFLRGNAFKYLIRYAIKGGLEDLYKAEDYVARLAAFEAERMKK